MQSLAHRHSAIKAVLVRKTVSLVFTADGLLFQPERREDISTLFPRMMTPLVM